MSFFVLWNLNEHKPTTCSECISYVDCVEHYSTAWGVKTMSEKNWGREKRLVAWWRRQNERKERKGEERRENEEEEERSGVASKCIELLITMLHLLLPSLLLRSLMGWRRGFGPLFFPCCIFGKDLWFLLAIISASKLFIFLCSSDCSRIAFTKAGLGCPAPNEWLRVAANAPVPLPIH